MKKRSKLESLLRFFLEMKMEADFWEKYYSFTELELQEFVDLFEKCHREIRDYRRASKMVIHGISRMVVNNFEGDKAEDIAVKNNDGNPAVFSHGF